MKIFDIALKDLWRSLHNAFFLVFGLVLPLLTATLFHFAFGGMASGEDGFELPTTSVQVVNLDQGQMGFSAGQMLVDVLQEAIPGVIDVTKAPDAASARAAVDRQEAAVAVIIPTNFTAAVIDTKGRAAVELYQDPTLTLGPSIVKGIVGQLVDGFAGSKITTGAVRAQLAAQGVTVDATMLQGIAMQYADWAAGLGQSQEGANLFFDIEPPTSSQEKGNTDMAIMLGRIMAGMMVFYVFFTGAAAAQSILQEEEEGTLPRLFTTPTRHSHILGGKFVSVFVLLVFQVSVLVTASTLIFGINWGQPLPVALVVVGLVVVAAGFGIFITSFLKDTRQAGIVYGGVMTVMGMVGMISVFTASVPGESNPLANAALVVPQGWGVRAWELLLRNGAISNDLLSTVGVMLALSVIFLAVGIFRFQKRYA